MDHLNTTVRIDVHVELDVGRALGFTSQRIALPGPSDAGLGGLQRQETSLLPEPLSLLGSAHTPSTDASHSLNLIDFNLKSPFQSLPVLISATNVHWRSNTVQEDFELLVKLEAFADVGVAHLGMGNAVRVTLRSTSCARSWLSSMPSSRDASLGREMLEYSLSRAFRLGRCLRSYTRPAKHLHWSLNAS